MIHNSYTMESVYLPVAESQVFHNLSLKVYHFLKQLLTLFSSFACTESEKLHFTELVNAVEASGGSSCPTSLRTETVTECNMSEEEKTKSKWEKRF